MSIDLLDKNNYSSNSDIKLRDPITQKSLQLYSPGKKQRISHPSWYSWIKETHRFQGCY